MLCWFLPYKKRVLVTQSCPPLCNSMDCSPQGSSVHGILQARILEWVAISFSNNKRESAIIMHTCLPSGIPLPSLHPIPPGHCRMPDWAPCAHSDFSPAIHLKPESISLVMLFSPFIPLSPSPTVSTSLFSTSVLPFLPCK